MGPSANSDTPTGGGQLIGYARVSTRHQDLPLQLNALEQAGCQRVFPDVGSGTLRKRPQLEACLDYVRGGDTLVVWRLDRLGRSLRHLVDVIAQLEARQVAFLSPVPALPGPPSLPHPSRSAPGPGLRALDPSSALLVLL